MAANPYEKQYRFGPDGRPIEELPSTAPEMTPQERIIPSLGNPVPAQPVALEALAPTSVAPVPVKNLESLAPREPNLSIMDQGNGGTVEGNVAAINRQTEALRSLREARNPGITTGALGQVQGQQPVDIWARPGDSWGDSGKRQQEYEGLLRQAASQTGFGAAKRAASMTAAAQAMMAPGLARDEQQAGLLGKQMDLQSDRAKSLADMYQRQQITPYQQQQLNLQQQQLDSTQGLKRQETVTKGLDNIQTNLYGSQEYKNYVTTQPMLQTVKDLAGQDTPTAGTALATAVAKSRDPSTGVLSGEVKAIMEGSGNIPQRALGWINSNILGGNPFTPGVRQDMVNATASQVNNYRDQAMAKVDSLIPELQQRGIALNTVLNENDLKTYQEWKAKQQGAQTQGQAQYRWDGSRLVPVQ